MKKKPAITMVSRLHKNRFFTPRFNEIIWSDSPIVVAIFNSVWVHFLLSERHVIILYHMMEIVSIFHNLSNFLNINWENMNWYHQFANCCQLKHWVYYFHLYSTKIFLKSSWVGKHNTTKMYSVNFLQLYFICLWYMDILSRLATITNN